MALDYTMEVIFHEKKICDFYDVYPSVRIATCIIFQMIRIKAGQRENTHSQNNTNITQISNVQKSWSIKSRQSRRLMVTRKNQPSNHWKPTCYVHQWF